VEPTALSAHMDVSLSTNYRKGDTLGQTCLDRRSTKRKGTSHGPTQQDSNKTQMKKKGTERITYIKTTACVEATRRCVQMSRLKHVGRTTTITVRDREVRSDGASLLDALGYNSLGRPRFRHNCSRYMSYI
jgi:hypothetical protein